MCWKDRVLIASQLLGRATVWAGELKERKHAPAFAHHAGQASCMDSAMCFGEAS
jgi:hypothetical protein